jgi:hypothetical protein
MDELEERGRLAAGHGDARPRGTRRAEGAAPSMMSYIDRTLASSVTTPEIQALRAKPRKRLLFTLKRADHSRPSYQRQLGRLRCLAGCLGVRGGSVG